MIPTDTINRFLTGNFIPGITISLFFGHAKIVRAFFSHTRLLRLLKLNFDTVAMIVLRMLYGAI